MDREEFIVRIFLVLLVILFSTIVVTQQAEISKAKKIEQEVVEQYCHNVHKYSVDNYLTCKDNDAQTILINLSDEATNNLAKVPKKEIEEAVKNDKKIK